MLTSILELMGKPGTNVCEKSIRSTPISTRPISSRTTLIYTAVAVVPVRLVTGSSGYRGGNDSLGRPAGVFLGSGGPLNPVADQVRASGAEEGETF